MTEEDTFRKLKSLTLDEAIKLYHELDESWVRMPNIKTIGDLHDYIDNELRKYGWSLMKLYRYDEANVKWYGKWGDD